MKYNKLKAAIAGLLLAYSTATHGQESPEDAGLENVLKNTDKTPLKAEVSKLRINLAAILDEEAISNSEQGIIDAVGSFSEARRYVQPVIRIGYALNSRLEYGFLVMENYREEFAVEYFFIRLIF